MAVGSKYGVRIFCLLVTFLSVAEQASSTLNQICQTLSDLSLITLEPFAKNMREEGRKSKYEVNPFLYEVSVDNLIFSHLSLSDLSHLGTFLQN